MTFRGWLVGGGPTHLPWSLPFIQGLMTGKPSLLKCGWAPFTRRRKSQIWPSGSVWSPYINLSTPHRPCSLEINKPPKVRGGKRIWWEESNLATDRCLEGCQSGRGHGWGEAEYARGSDLGRLVLLQLPYAISAQCSSHFWDQYTPHALVDKLGQPLFVIGYIQFSSWIHFNKVNQ